MSVAKLQSNVCSILKPELLKLGFESDEYSPHFNVINFSEVLTPVTKHIRLQFYYDSISLNYIRGFISPNEVNRILEKFVVLKRNIEYITLKNFGMEEEVVQDFERLRVIGKEGSDVEYSSAILAHTNKFILPFLNQYPDLQSINDKILNQVPEEEFVKWFHGKSTLKILIIMKLCDNPKYDSYRDSKMKEGLAAVKSDPQRWQSPYDRFLSLVKYLE